MLDGLKIKNVDELEFTVFCIENLAIRLGKNAEEIYRILTDKTDILRSYIIPEYEILHTEKFKRRGRKGIISRYNFEEKAYQELKILRFDTYSEEWLSFILNCRTGNDSSDYDIVIGGVANDKVFNTVELYFDNCIMKGVNRFERQSDFIAKKICAGYCAIR